MNDQINTPKTANSNGNLSLIKVLSYTAEKTKELADANSVLGEKIQIGDVTVIPVSKLSVGFAGGGADVADISKKKKQNPAGAGAKVTLTPMSFVVISSNEVEIVSADVPSGSKKTDIIESIVNQIKQFIAERKAKKQAEKLAEEITE